MKNKKKLSTIIIVLITILTIVAVLATHMLSNKNTSDKVTNNSDKAIDISGYKDNTGDIQIRSAAEHLADDGSVDGYIVRVASKGYNGEILMDVALDKTGNKITSLEIASQSEIPEYGGKITEDIFLSQFSNIAAPVYLQGMSISGTGSTTDKTAQTEVSPAPGTIAANTIYTDGTYKAESEEYTDFEFNDVVTLTITGGKITNVTWDGYNKDGEFKSLLSADGAFEMTKDGLPWHEQALAITKFVVENQSTDAIVCDSAGKTDSISGVSISVTDFINLVEECLKQATATPISSNETTAEETTAAIESTAAAKTTSTGAQVEAVSGATISSAAVVNGVNKAQAFIKNFVLAK